MIVVVMRDLVAVVQRRNTDFISQAAAHHQLPVCLHRHLLAQLLYQAMRLR